MTGRFVHVLLPLPLDSPYTYRLPDDLSGSSAIGARVTVPLRRRPVTGIIIGHDVPPPEREARDVTALLDDEPALSPALLDLADWMRRYYGAPHGLALRAVLPGAMWAAGGGVRPHDERAITLSGGQLSLSEREERFRRRPRQRALYEALEALGGSSSLRHLRDQLGFGDAVVRGLVRSGLARLASNPAPKDPFADLVPTPLPGTLTPAQRLALEQIDGMAAGESALLYGVTGSGKTLVYLEAAREVLETGGGVIVLVPEIGLTPQTVSRFRGAFGDEVAVLHSGLSDGERADAWRALRSGNRRVAVGPRSALFAPVQHLGLIVVDEEHEASYKNGESPRYVTRDVAAVRARIEGARLILGSATPVLESWERASDGSGGMHLLRLPDRIEARPMPPVELVDLRSAPVIRDLLPVPWSEALDDAVADALRRGEQVILLLNRRGFANFLQCTACGTVRECPQCSIALTVHRTPHGLRCHYCGHGEPVPEACAACGGVVQQMRGIGTQQLEQAMAARFPSARIARMDLDTTSSKWSHRRILGAVERGEVDILLGTQMIAKGLDFPNVTLVGVVDADTGLFLPDFRAAERTFQLLAQVSGRAGRGPKGGRVLVQTRAPAHAALTFAAAHDTPGFLAAESATRRSPLYPPHTTLLNAVLSGPDEEAVSAAAVRFAEWVARVIARHGLPLDVLGPAPCPVARLRERWRWHVLVRGPRQPLGRLVRAAARNAARHREPRLVLDRDPASLL